MYSELDWGIVFNFSAVTPRPTPSKEMMERREQILAMPYGMRSLSYFQEETKLWKCNLLGEEETTYDGYYPKYGKWTEVPIPLMKTPPLRQDLDLSLRRAKMSGQLKKVQNIVKGVTGHWPCFGPSLACSSALRKTRSIIVWLGPMSTSSFIGMIVG